MHTALCSQARILAIAVVGWAAASAAEMTLTIDQVPTQVRTTITDNTGGSAVDAITSDDTQGTVVYAVRFRDASTKASHTLRVAHDGKLLASGPSGSEPAVGASSTGVRLTSAPPAVGAVPPAPAP